MALNIIGLPANWRSPGTYISNQPSSGGGTVGLLPTMLVGQMLSSGTATANVPIPVFSQADVNASFGAESQLAGMFANYRLNDPTGSIFAVPLADNSAGTAASVLVTVTGAATAAGTVSLYINNVAVYAAVTVGDTPTVVGAAINAAINAAAANPFGVLGVTSSVVAGVVTITAVHKGATAGDLQVTVNKNGTASNESTPAGLGVTVGTFTAGTADPDCTSAFANITALPWSFLICPYTSNTVNGQVFTLLSDVVGRWSPLNQLYGVRFAAVRGTMSGMTTYGASVGSNKHMTTIGIGNSQTSVSNAAAIFGGLAAVTVRANPGLPITGVLQGLDAPSVTQRLRRVDENTLLYSGISPIRVDNSGNATLPRCVQEYSTDTTYLSVEVDFLVEYVDTYIRSDLETTYHQSSLLADGNPVLAGSGATTPSLILQHVWGLYLDLEALGIVQNSKQFISTSYAEADIHSGTVGLFLPVQVVGQLRVIRILNSFS